MIEGASQRGVIEVRVTWWSPALRSEGVRFPTAAPPPPTLVGWRRLAPLRKRIVPNRVGDGMGPGMFSPRIGLLLAMVGGLLLAGCTSRERPVEVGVREGVLHFSNGGNVLKQFCGIDKKL